jgi:hypothetical protein
MNSESGSIHFDFEALEEKLAEADCEAPASEVQGMQCGMLAAGMRVNDSQWSDILISMINDGRVFAAETMQMLQEILHWTHNELTQNDTLTPLLLPDDDYPLIDRMEALAYWCQGFLLGFGVQHGQQLLNNSEVEESLADLTEISRLELDSEDGEEMQKAFETIVEHVKVAVKIIYWEMVVKNVPGSQTRVKGNDTLH